MRDEAHAVEAMRKEFAGVDPPPNMPLDDRCLARYARARNLDESKASHLLHQTIAWRKRFGADDLLAPERYAVIKREAATGKTFVPPFTDKQGRAILVMRPSRENTHDHDGNLLHLVYQMERIVASMAPAGPEKLLLLIDFKGYSMLNAPPMKTSRETLNILQHHYPERLGKAVLFDAPWLFSATFKALTPFIDPVTREKISFFSTSSAADLDALGEIVDRDLLEKGLGGRNAKDLFDADAYFEPTADPLVAGGLSREELG